MKQTNISDQYLVIEQKGMRVLVSGLIIALIMAMTFRAIFSPQRIKYEIERVIEESSQQKAEIKIEKAYLSLAQGWFPRLAVVIENLEIQSQDPCLYFAKMGVASMVLPVSLQSIFDRTLVLKKLEMDHLVVHLKIKDIKCNTSLFKPPVELVGRSVSPLPLSESVPVPVSTGVVPSLLPLAKEIGAAPIVQTLSIEGSPLKEVLLTNGELHFDSYPDFYLQINRMAAELSDKPEKMAFIDGNLELIPVTDDRLVGWSTRFQMEATEQLIKSHFKGQWREGGFIIDLEYKAKENELALTGEFKQVPLGQIFIFSNELGWSQVKSTAHQSWISFKTEYSQYAKKAKELLINNVKIEGDFGDIKIPKLVAGGEPLVWQPLRVELNSVSISKLFSAFEQQHPSNSLSSLGVFNGVVDLEGLNFKGVQGDLKGLEFVFSNKGIRDVQVVDQMHLDVSALDNQFRGRVTDIQLRDGEFKGQVDGVFNKLDSSTQIQMVLEQFKLNSKVEKLMTGKGFLSSIQGRLNFLFKKDQSTQVQGQIKADSGQIEKINFEKLKWDINSIKNESIWHFSFANLKWNIDSPLWDTWQDILNTDSSELEMKNFSVKAKKSDTSFEWSELQAQVVEPKAKILSQGSWDEDGKLKGNIQVKSEKEFHQITIGGTRISPEWNSN